jgi:hypothetical protein
MKTHGTASKTKKDEGLSLDSQTGASKDPRIVIYRCPTHFLTPKKEQEEAGASHAQDALVAAGRTESKELKRWYRYRYSAPCRPLVASRRGQPSEALKRSTLHMPIPGDDDCSCDCATRLRPPRSRTEGGCHRNRKGSGNWCSHHQCRRSRSLMLSACVTRWFSSRLLQSG